MFRFDPYSPAIDADPFPAYRRLRDDFPCFWSDEANAWVLSRFADIVAALNDWRTYSSAKGNLMTEVRNRVGATLGTTDPPRHDRLRGLVQYAFMKRNLDSLTPEIHAIARDVYDGADPKTVVYVGNKKVGDFLKKKVFDPGRTITWNELTTFATGAPLSPAAFAKDFSGKN